MIPKGLYAAQLRTLVPKAIPDMAFGTRDQTCAVYGPLGLQWTMVYGPTLIVHLVLTDRAQTIKSSRGPHEP